MVTGTLSSTTLVRSKDVLIGLLTAKSLVFVLEELQPERILTAKPRQKIIFFIKEN